MKRPTITAALVLLMLLTLFGHGDTVQAQVTCTGHARSLGWSYYGTAGGDLINCRGSIADVVILGLGGNDILIGGRATIRSWVVLARTSYSAGVAGIF